VHLTCQFCESNELSSLLDLGYLPPVNLLRAFGTDALSQETFSLELFVCEDCKLVQISNTLDSDLVFPSTYPYLSGVTKVLIDNFAEQASLASRELNLSKSDLVVDIGSNDGSLLNFYSEFSQVVGIEPTDAAIISEKRGIITYKNYFDSTVVDLVVASYGKAKLITACNVFAHVPKMNELMRNIKNLLTEDGIFISESHYFADLVDSYQFDTIYHEHLRYYTVGFLKRFLESHGMEIFRVDRIGTHGGSIRVWASNAGKTKIQDSVQNALSFEMAKNLDATKTLQLFGEKVCEWRHKFRGLIADIKMNGHSIYALGAPSRASTLISFCGLTNLEISGIGEIQGSAKIGKYMPGTRIPVLEESLILDKNPEYILLLSWHISEILIANLKMQGYRGKIIIPLPEPIVFEIKY